MALTARAKKLMVRAINRKYWRSLDFVRHVRAGGNKYSLNM